MTEIYIVNGTTGEYSDRTEWVVRAFTDKFQAEEFIRKLEKLYRSVEPVYNKYNMFDIKYRNALKKVLAQDDPHFYLDYTGAGWFLTECKLYDTTS